jgi:hypothetical protein
VWRWCIPLFLLIALYGERRTGELRLSVADSTGAGIEAAGSLLSQALQLNQTFSTDNQGRYIARNLPFGLYRLNIDRPGFAPFSTLLEIRSEVPLEYSVTLRIAPIETALIVEDSATLLDAHGPGLLHRRRNVA